MAYSDEQLKALLELCTSSTFAHSDEVIPLLADPARAEQRGAKIELYEMPMASTDGKDDFAEFRRTYRIRAAHLSEMERRGTLCKPSRSGRTLPFTLAADIRELSAALDSAKEQPLAIWDLRLPDQVCYGIFVLTHDRRIAGCYKSIEEAQTNE